MTEPIDDVHAMSCQAIADIRRDVAVLRSQVAFWQPGPCPAEWGINNQPTRHNNRRKR